MGSTRTRWIHANAFTEIERVVSFRVQYVPEPKWGTSRHTHTDTAEYSIKGNTRERERHNSFYILIARQEE